MVEDTLIASASRSAQQSFAVLDTMIRTAKVHLPPGRLSSTRKGRGQPFSEPNNNAGHDRRGGPRIADPHSLPSYAVLTTTLCKTPVRMNRCTWHICAREDEGAATPRFGMCSWPDAGRYSGRAGGGERGMDGDRSRLDRASRGRMRSLCASESLRLLPPEPAAATLPAPDAPHLLRVPTELLKSLARAGAVVRDGNAPFLVPHGLDKIIRNCRAFTLLQLEPVRFHCRWPALDASGYCYGNGP